MALVKQTTTPHGIICNGAYYRVIEYFMSTKDRRIGMQVAMYADERARWQELEPISIKPYQIFYDKKYKINVSKRIILSSDTESKLIIEGQEFDNDESLLEELQNSSLANDLEFVLQNNEYNNALELIISAKDGGQFEGAAGNTLEISGDAIVAIDTLSYGQDEHLSTFETMFDVDVLDGENINPIKQCYEYLKTLPEFEGAVDA